MFFVFGIEEVTRKSFFFFGLEVLGAFYSPDMDYEAKGHHLQVVVDRFDLDTLGKILNLSTLHVAIN